MVVMSVEVPKQLANKFLSNKIVQFKDLSIEEQLLNIDGEGWDDSFVNMNVNDFLKTLKKDVINYKI